MRRIRWTFSWLAILALIAGTGCSYSLGRGVCSGGDRDSSDTGVPSRARGEERAQ